MTKKAQLEEKIAGFLKFAKGEIPVFSIFITDDQRVRKITFLIDLEDDNSIRLMELYANIAYFGHPYFDATLCHELGHMLAAKSEIHLPLGNFISSLKNEIAADQEGLRLFFLAGKGLLDYGRPLDSSFRFIFKNLCFSKGRKRFAKMLLKNLLVSLSLLISMARYAIIRT